MKLKESKCGYMIFTRTKANFTTRLTVNNAYLERKMSVNFSVSGSVMVGLT